MLEKFTIVTLQIIHMTDSPLRHLRLRNLHKSSSAPEALYSSSAELVDSMSNSTVRQELKRMVAKPLDNNCNEQSQRQDEACDASECFADALVDDDSIKAITNGIGVDLTMGRRNDDKNPMTKQKYKSIRKWKTFMAGAITHATHIVIFAFMYYKIIILKHFFAKTKYVICILYIHVHCYCVIIIIGINIYCYY